MTAHGRGERNCKADHERDRQSMNQPPVADAHRYSGNNRRQYASQHPDERDFSVAHPAAFYASRRFADAARLPAVEVRRMRGYCALMKVSDEDCVGGPGPLPVDRVPCRRSGVDNDSTRFSETLPGNDQLT